MNYCDWKVSFSQSLQTLYGFQVPDDAEFDDAIDPGKLVAAFECAPDNPDDAAFVAGRQAGLTPVLH